MAREFVDTNILVYAFSDDPKSRIADNILLRGCEISVQGLNEFVNVARRKQKRDWREIQQAIATIRILCTAIHPIDLDIHDQAVALSERYGFTIFDALVVASALAANCTRLYSEDMQHGLLVAGSLQISNPFVTDQ